MLMIGVTPLPALMNSSAGGGGSSSKNVPSTPPRRTTVPARARRSRNGDTRPPSSSLGVIAMRPSRLAGSDVSEYARQWCTPSTATPSRTYWPGLCPGHSQPGLITTVDARVVSGSTR